MRISAIALIIFSVSIAQAAPVCGLFKVQGYVRQGAPDELILNPEAVSRTVITISNPEMMQKYAGRVVKAELWLKNECHLKCEGRLEKINGTVSPYEKVETFSRQKETLLKVQNCLK